MMGVRSLGQVLFAQNRYDEAEALIQEGLSTSREFGGDNFTEDLEYWLGQIALTKKDYELAAKRFLDSLSRASEYSNLELVVHNHNALGKLDLVQNRRPDSRKRFRDALRLALLLKQRPLILDCLAHIADLYIEEANMDFAALLIVLILDDTASRAKLRERAADQLSYILTNLSSNKIETVRQRAEQSDPIQVAEQLLQDLEIM